MARQRKQQRAEVEPQDPRVFAVSLPQAEEAQPLWDAVEVALSNPLRHLALCMMPWGGLEATSFGGSLGHDENGKERGALPPLTTLRNLRQLLEHSDAILDLKPGGNERKQLREEARLLIDDLHSWTIEADVWRCRVNPDGSFAVGQLDPMEVPKGVVLGLSKLAEIGRRLKIGMLEDEGIPAANVPRTAGPLLTKGEDRALRLLQEQPPQASGHPGALTIPQVAAKLSLGEDEAGRLLRSLKEKGVADNEARIGYWATVKPQG